MFARLFRVGAVHVDQAVHLQLVGYARQMPFEEHHLEGIPGAVLQHWAISCAERQLSVYEAAFAGDGSAREVISVSRAWADDPDSTRSETAARMHLVTAGLKAQGPAFRAGQAVLDAESAVLSGGGSHFACRAANHAALASPDPDAEFDYQVKLLAEMMSTHSSVAELEVASALLRDGWEGTLQDALDIARTAIQ